VVLHQDPAPAPDAVLIRAGTSHKPPRSLEITVNSSNGHGGGGIFTENPVRDLARSLRRLGANGGQHSHKQETSAIFPGNFYDDSTFT
jgi:hypothetical protein